MPVMPKSPAEPAPRIAEHPTAQAAIRLWVFFLLAFVVSWTLWLPLAWWTPPEPARGLLLVAGTFGLSLDAAALIVARRGRLV